jgi:hypothetical protein
MKVRIVHIAMILAIFLLAFAGGAGIAGAIPLSDMDSGAQEHTVFLPIAQNSEPIVLGIYPQNWPGLQQVMDDEFHSLDEWAGKRLSLAGTFVDFVPPENPEVDHYYVNIEYQLGIMRDNDYTPFLNLNTNSPQFTAQYIASGSADNYIRLAAQAYKNYTQDGTRMAFIAPLQEMNYSGVVYADTNPTYFIQAFRRFQQIFTEEGVQDQSVVWVFAPNGPSSPGFPGFEAYYPGDEYAEAVGISGYHLGHCPSVDPSVRGWQGPQATIGQYLERMTTLAPDKPMFVAQTGTSVYNSRDGQIFRDYATKDQWLYDAYSYLTGFSNLFGVLYYNRWADTEGCQWAFYYKFGSSDDGYQYDGFRQAIAGPVYQYISPDELKQDFPDN